MPDQSIEKLKSKIGKSKDVVEDMRIEAGKVAEFARAIGCNDQIYYDEDAAKTAGLNAIPAPVTFLRTSVFPRHRSDGPAHDPVFELGFDDRYEVHGEHSFTFQRPVYVGDVLSARATLVDVYQRESAENRILTFAIQKTTYRDEDDDAVATERMTVIEVPPTDGSSGEL